ncbi:RidA family protein [Phyllobacterium leguminum]|uniref:Enamine deaminase RidA (YjgF/YER057c/UK114 family) n=1 Tax=Phyllobacterium leguminum TaxID=314237 RepID=A0A318T5M7_9HYPH|nr:RidA family protein [Phyllobacterium leguminum]PYE88175.1 enamine deaminase RidA (YjgF/YER057c/UK114 family) [Phyllobacterium leguminum]
MSETIEIRLAALGITIPEAAAPVANYVPYAQSGALLFTSGQLPLVNGKLIHAGLLGDGLNVVEGQEAARASAINVLAQAKAALGDLNRIKRIVKITIFVASTPDFIEHHLVANGASDLFVAVLGDAGRHARSAVGMASLPFNAPVEIEAIIEAA